MTGRSSVLFHRKSPPFFSEPQKEGGLFLRSSDPKIFRAFGAIFDNFTVFWDVCLLFSLAKIVVVAVFYSKISRLRRFDSYFKMQKPLKASIEKHTGNDLNCAVFRSSGIAGSGGNSKWARRRRDFFSKTALKIGDFQWKNTRFRMIIWDT